MIKPKVILIGLAFAHDNYLTNHVSVLSDKYDVVSIRIDEDPLISKIFRRRSFITLPFELVLLLYIFSTNRSAAVVSIGPKVGLLSVIACKLLFLRNYHWFTGQVWALKKRKYLSFSYICDLMIYLLSNGILCDGLTQKKYLHENFPLKKDIIVPKYGSINGVHEKFFSQTESLKLIDELKVCFVGRKTNGKGLALLYEVAKKASDLNINCTFTLAGPIDLDSNEYNVFLNNNSKLKNITLIDDYVDPVYIFKTQHALVLPSEREGFGSIVIEAQSMGLPVIVSDIYGLNDSFINNVTGIKCRASSVEDFVRAIIKMKDPNNYMNYRNNSYKFSQKFQSLHFCEDLLESYKLLGLL